MAVVRTSINYVVSCYILDPIKHMFWTSVFGCCIYVEKLRHTDVEINLVFLPPLLAVVGTSISYVVYCYILDMIQHMEYIVKIFNDIERHL